MNPLEFEIGELVKFGPMLWADVSIKNNDKWEHFINEKSIENQIGLYLKKRHYAIGYDLCHEVLFDNAVYLITDNSYAIDKDEKRNLQKVIIKNED